MPFRKRQSMSFCGAGVIEYMVGTPDSDTGVVEFKGVPQNGPSAVLPSADMMDLESMLKAGVDMRKVNCKLISPDVHSLVVRLGDIKDTETNTPETNTKTSTSEETSNEK